MSVDKKDEKEKMPVDKKDEKEEERRPDQTMQNWKTKGSGKEMAASLLDN